MASNQKHFFKYFGKKNDDLKKNKVKFISTANFNRSKSIIYFKILIDNVKLIIENSKIKVNFFMKM